MASASSCIAVVVAAGESPALQRLHGRTLLARAIATARSAACVGRVIAMSDAAPVQDEAAAAGAESRTAKDLAAGDAALIEALSADLADADVVVLIDPAAALVEAADVEAVQAAVSGHGADCAFAAVAARHAVLQHRTEPPEPLAMTPETALLVDAEAVRAVRVAAWRTARERLFGVVAAVPLPPERALRADTSAALRSIAAIAATGEAARSRERLPVRPAALIMDFDGVFTDNRVVVDQDGREAVLCNRSDGLGLEQLRRHGLPMLVLSKERNPVVAARCTKLKLDYLQAVEDKGPALLDWCRNHGIDPADAVYVGNDTNDLACFELVGCAVAVADAHPAALAAADVVLTRAGGFGALRELTDHLAQRLSAGD